MLLAPEHLFLQFCSLPNGNFPFPSSPPFVLTWNSVRKNATWPNVWIEGYLFYAVGKKAYVIMTSQLTWPAENLQDGHTGISNFSGYYLSSSFLASSRLIFL